MPDKYDENRFLPSARSMAFMKKVWEDVGGFNEKLERAGEDTLFCFEALDHGYKIFRNKEAIVYWETPKTFKESIKKYYVYAKGDAQAGVWLKPSRRAATHNLKISSVFGRYCLGFSLLIISLKFSSLLSILFILIIIYIFWSILSKRNNAENWHCILLMPIIQIASDLAVIGGYISGLF